MNTSRVRDIPKCYYVYHDSTLLFNPRVVGNQNNEEFTNQKIFYYYFFSKKCAEKFTKVYIFIRRKPTVIFVQNMRVARKLLYNCHLASAIFVSFLFISNFCTNLPRPLQNFTVESVERKKLRSRIGGILTAFLTTREIYSFLKCREVLSLHRPYRFLQPLL